MKKNFVEELKWRGMIHDMMPGAEEQFQKEVTRAYIGFDPTADSLHVGHLVQIMTLRHLQNCGHQPIVLVGGATGMVGDPSGKSAERNLLGEEELQHNVKCVQHQLSKFLDFEGENAAELVNNYDWFKSFNFLEFIRDVGKHITVNYMMAKDSVKKRLETGLSFTEFTYQLVQGYDFYWLWKNKGAKVQLGGSDQWGNIVTGTELIRRKGQGEAWAITTPLITKADGTKFGKSEGGNVWLDPKRTSPYKFYQYWLNAADDDVTKYIRIFSEKSQEEIEAIEAAHNEAPHQRALQHALAEELTIRVHSEEALQMAKAASSILFGKSSEEELRSLDRDTFLQVFEAVPQAEVSLSAVNEEGGIIDLLVKHSGFLKSNADARRSLKENAISINKSKVKDDFMFSQEQLINEEFILLQRGKKNYFLLRVNG
jgi:tyrosyl-tRNA synthetase